MFTIQPDYPDLSGHVIAFVIAPTISLLLPNSLAGQYLGLFDKNSEGNYNNHIFALEFDTIVNSEFKDIDDNHVGIDMNELLFVESATTGYYFDDGSFKYFSLDSGNPHQVWVEYDKVSMDMYVTIAPVAVAKPNKPLLSGFMDPRFTIEETMYIGFSSSSCFASTHHYVLGWSFKSNGVAEALDLCKLGKPPRVSKRKSKLLLIFVPLVAFSIVTTVGVIYLVIMGKKKNKFAEVLEDWELKYGPCRFK